MKLFGILQISLYATVDVIVLTFKILLHETPVSSNETNFHDAEIFACSITYCSSYRDAIR